MDKKFKKQIVETFAFTTNRRLGLFWRCLLYLFFWIIALGISQYMKVSADKRGLPQIVSGLLYLVVASSSIIGITALFRRFLDRHPWKGIGLTNIWKSLPHMILGWFTGCVLIAFVFAIEYVLGWIHIEGNEIAVSGWPFVLDWIVGGFLTFLAVGITEEVSCRGYLFQNLGEQFPLWLTALIVGVVFVSLHGNQGMGYFFGVVLISVFLVLTRLATKSLWFAITFHGAWDWMQMRVLGIGQVHKPDFGHALLHVSQHGPELFVGRSPQIEGGLIISGLLVVAIGCIWFYMQRMQRAVTWNSYLTDTGEPISTRNLPVDEAQG